MLPIKLKRLFHLHITCRIKGHDNEFTMFHNGWKKGTMNTHNPIPLYQAKCKRCNRYYGDKIDLKEFK